MLVQVVVGVSCFSRVAQESVSNAEGLVDDLHAPRRSVGKLEPWQPRSSKDTVVVVHRIRRLFILFFPRCVADEVSTSVFCVLLLVFCRMLKDDMSISVRVGVFGTRIGCKTLFLSYFSKFFLSEVHFTVVQELTSQQKVEVEELHPRPIQRPPARPEEDTDAEGKA